MHVTPDTSILSATQQLDNLMPLLFFYGDGGGLPEVKFLPGHALPEPAHHLLVHASDMTPRLAGFHQAVIDLEVRRRELSPDAVIRAVILRRRTDHQAVEFGAVLIRLDTFPSHARELVAEGLVPLGTILEQEKIAHSSHPRAYFSVMMDATLASLFQHPAGERLYGRCNELRDADGIVFADIVEILPNTTATEVVPA